MVASLNALAREPLRVESMGNSFVAAVVQSKVR
jgi:hypothetical protein